MKNPDEKNAGYQYLVHLYICSLGEPELIPKIMEIIKRDY